VCVRESAHEREIRDERYSGRKRVRACSRAQGFGFSELFTSSERGRERKRTGDEAHRTYLNPELNPNPI
jgi:hypothetical protein